MSGHEHRDFWAVFFGAAARPWPALKALENDPAGPKKGILAQGPVLVVSILIVGIFLIKGHAA